MLGPRKLRFRFVDFLVKIWLLNAWPHLNLPLPVLRKRFAAARLVLIFGMGFSFVFERHRVFALMPQSALWELDGANQAGFATDLLNHQN
jgi:hypothetical protein